VSEPELERYRADVRAWVKDNLPSRTRDSLRRRTADKIPESQIAASRARQRKVFEAGYLGITLPVEYGGQGLTAEHERIWYEESASYALPVAAGVATYVTLGIVLPTVLAHGSEEQKRDWIPKMLSGEETWAQLLSEPAAGSDLAGLRTRATRDGDQWVINGAKVWSSGADMADFGICLARTDWEVPKHRGLTWFKVPLDDSRVTVRPIREINGSAAFCEEFLDDVIVGDEMVIGAVNGGWPIASTLLAYERAGGSHGGHGIIASAEAPRGPGLSRQLPADLVALAHARGLENDPATRQLIARVHVNDYMQAQLADRVTQLARSGKANPAAASLLKLGIGEVQPRRAQLAMEIAGRAGIAWDADDEDAGATALNYLSGRVMSIGGGSDQIQRNIIAERLLGLPREPSFDTDKPFREVLQNAKQWR
jgi:alkylation response protein AidB-like acyl-CoA dehydrogenase